MTDRFCPAKLVRTASIPARKGSSAASLPSGPIRPDRHLGAARLEIAELLVCRRGRDFGFDFFCGGRIGISMQIFPYD